MIVLIITPVSSDVIIIRESYAKSEVTYTTEMMWNQTYGGNFSELAYALIQTTDNGFALAGSTRSYGAGMTDMWLVKTDSNGTIQWNRTYGGTTGEEAHNLLQTTDGSFVLAGNIKSYDNDTINKSMWLVKTDSNGMMLWNQTFGETEYTYAEKLIQTEDGGFVIAGSTRSYDGNESDMCLLKTDENGLIQWNHTFGGRNREECHGLIKTNDNGFALAGSTRSYGVGESDMWLVKTDANGGLQWNQTYGGALFDSAHNVIQTTDAGFALVGHTGSYGAGEYDMWLVRTDSSGMMLWNGTYGGTRRDYANVLIQTEDGGFLLAGNTRSYGAGMTDMWLVRTDSNGIEQYNRSYGGTEDESAYALLQTADDSFVIAGVTSTYGAGGDDMWFVKISYNESYTSSIPYNVIFGSFLLLLIASFLVFVLLYQRQRK